MKLTNIVFILPILFFTMSEGEAGTKSTDLSKYGKHFQSTQGGLTIEMVSFTKKNTKGLHDVLMKVTGQAAERAGVDGIVMRYAAKPSGTGFDLTYKKGKETRTRVSSRQRWGNWSSFELYLDNQKFKVYENERMSKHVRPAHIFTEFEAPKKIVNKTNFSLYGKIMKSHQGSVVIEMVSYKKKNKKGLYDVIMKISGQTAEEAGIDGKVMRYSAVPTGSGYNLTYKKGGETGNRIAARKGWGNHFGYQLYLGGKTIDIGVDERASMRVIPKHLETELTKK